MRDFGDRILTQTYHSFLNHRGDLWFFFGRSHGWLFASLWLIPAFGWQSMLVVAGIVPCLLALVLTWKLPESHWFYDFEKTAE